MDIYKKILKNLNAGKPMLLEVHVCGKLDRLRLIEPGKCTYDFVDIGNSGDFTRSCFSEGRRFSNEVLVARMETYDEGRSYPLKIKKITVI